MTNAILLRFILSAMLLVSCKQRLTQETALSAVSGEYLTSQRLTELNIPAVGLKFKSKLRAEDLGSAIFISDRHILTAAHVAVDFAEGSSLKLIYGSDGKELSVLNTSEYRLHIHPKFVEAGLNSDVAVIEILKPNMQWPFTGYWPLVINKYVKQLMLTGIGYGNEGNALNSPSGRARAYTFSSPTSDFDPRDEYAWYTTLKGTNCGGDSGGPGLAKTQTGYAIYATNVTNTEVVNCIAGRAGFIAPSLSLEWVQSIVPNIQTVTEDQVESFEIPTKGEWIKVSAEFIQKELTNRFKELMTKGGLVTASANLVTTKPMGFCLQKIPLVVYSSVRSEFVEVTEGNWKYSGPENPADRAMWEQVSKIPFDKEVAIDGQKAFAYRGEYTVQCGTEFVAVLTSPAGCATGHKQFRISIKSPEGEYFENSFDWLVNRSICNRDKLGELYATQLPICTPDLAWDYDYSELLLNVCGEKKQSPPSGQRANAVMKAP